MEIIRSDSDGSIEITSEGWILLQAHLVAGLLANPSIVASINDASEKSEQLIEIANDYVQSLLDDNFE